MKHLGMFLMIAGIAAFIALAALFPDSFSAKPGVYTGPFEPMLTASGAPLFDRGSR
jgi:hypothetical protein